MHTQSLPAQLSAITALLSNLQLIGSRYLNLNNAASDFDFLMQNNSQNVAELEALGFISTKSYNYNTKKLPLIEKSFRFQHDSLFGGNVIDVLTSNNPDKLFAVFRYCKDTNFFQNLYQTSLSPVEKKTVRVAQFATLCKNFW